MDQRDLTGTDRMERVYRRRVAGRKGGDACVSPEAILAVVQREGREDERLATLDHVMSCAACHREYELLAAVDEAAGESAGGSGAVHRAWWRSAPLALAASLAAVAAAALLMQGRLQRGEPVRGGAGDIALVAPGSGTAGAGDLTFVWHPVPGADGYVLELQYDGAVAFADTTTDTTLTLAEPDRLLPAAEYRWWVRELTDGAEPRSSELRTLRLPGR